MQKQAITPVDDAVRTLAKTDRLPRPQRDDLNNAGLIQRQVGSRMNNRDEGLDQKLRRLLDDLRNFKIANPDAQQQMQDMLARLDQLRDRHLGPAEQGLTRAGKSLEQIPESPPRALTTGRVQERSRPTPTRSRPKARPRTSRRRQGSSKAPARTSKAPARTSQGGRQGSAGRRTEAISGQESKDSPTGRRIRQAGPRRGQGRRADPRSQARAGRLAPGRRQEVAGRGQDQPEGDRRRAPEDARRPQRVRDLPGRGQGCAEPAQEAGRDDEADGRGRRPSPT